MTDVPIPMSERQHRLRERLLNLGPQQAAIFSVWCGERLLPRYRNFSLEANWGDPERLRSALDMCWKVVLGVELDRAAIVKEISACEAVTPDADDFAMRSVSYALRAAVCVAYALESLLPDAPAQAAVYASQTALEIIELQVGREALLHRLSSEDELVFIETHRDMLAEMGQQERAVEFLYAHSVMDATLVREFRRRLGE